MTARKVEEAGTRLRELRQDEWSDLGLAGVAMALAIAASTLHPPLALPLLIFPHNFICLFLPFRGDGQDQLTQEDHLVSSSSAKLLFLATALL